MAKNTFVSESEATKAKRVDSRRDARMIEYDRLMAEVVKNAPQVLRLEPEGDETARGLRLRVAQSANRVEKDNPNLGGSITGWTGDDGAVYVQFVRSANGATPEANATPAPAPKAAAKS